MAELSDVDERRDVDRELQQNRQYDVPVDDGSDRALLRQLVDGLQAALLVSHVDGKETEWQFKDVPSRARWS